ncbi:hypothetical protein MferCBS49748_004599 [Microsporum ferrugineum]
MPPEGLPFPQPSDTIYVFLALRAILFEPKSDTQISDGELKDIFKELPDGGDSILCAVVWQVDLTSLPNDPSPELIRVMELVATRNRCDVTGAWAIWKSRSKGNIKSTGIKEFTSELQEIIINIRLSKERLEFRNQLHDSKRVSIK